MRPFLVCPSHFPKDVSIFVLLIELYILSILANKLTDVWKDLTKEGQLTRIYYIYTLDVGGISIIT